MARYIDADALNVRLQDFAKWCRDGRKQGVDFVIDGVIPDIPTADVVPKSEVERLEIALKECKKDRYQVFPDGHLELLPRTDIDAIKSEVARKIFEEIDKLLFAYMVLPNNTRAINLGELSELKKKYTTEGERREQ